MLYRLLLTMLLFSASSASWAQCNPKEYKRIFSEAVALQKEGKFIEAKNSYEAAKIYACDKGAAADRKVDSLFKEIEKLRKIASEAQALADSALKEALKSDSITKQSLKTTQIAEQKADSAFQKADRLVKAFYFYANRFAVAYNGDYFYFIDKNGKQVKELGQWEKVEQFDKTGLAKVKTKEGFIRYIDTTGTTYKIAYSPTNNSFYEAIEIREKSRLTVIPKAITKNKKLKILIIESCQISVVSPAISELKSLKFLNLSHNALATLPKEMSALRTLMTLDLSYNQLKDLPNQMREMTNLYYLNLQGNPISEVERGKISQLLPWCTIVF